MLGTGECTQKEIGRLRKASAGPLCRLPVNGLLDQTNFVSPSPPPPPPLFLTDLL